VKAPGRGRALLALLLVTLIWGVAFLWMKQNLAAAERVLGRPGGIPVVAMYLGARFAIAAFALALWPQARRGLTKGAWTGGLVIGVLLTSGFFFQMLGLQNVTPPVSAFLTSLYVVFAAAFTTILHKTKPGPDAPHRSRPRDLRRRLHRRAAAPDLRRGRMADRRLRRDLRRSHPRDRQFTRASSPASVSLTSFVWTAVLGLAVTAVVSVRPGAPTPTQLLAVLTDRGFVTPLLLSATLATVLALTLMNMYQRALDPVRAAIVYALEPVWTTLVAWAVGTTQPGAGSSSAEAR
jgi:drug/metabolite transporter (DMT)-like permease